MRLSIAVKALNEEHNIARALHSALQAATPFGGEVILADSGSSDRTVAIACTLPVTVVQLADPGDRSCGAGAQLAFQHACGQYFYLLDADMVLDAGFIAAAIGFLEAHPDMAGVGGRLVERHTDGNQFKILARNLATHPDWLPGEVSRLDGGGLYRAAAIAEAGYFADRNLHAFEELELAARLQSRGWKLARIDRHAVDHFGHRLDSYRLLWRRVRSGYAAAAGEVLRAALGQPHLPIVLKNLTHIRNGAVVILWWAALLAGLLLLPGWWRLVALLALLGAPVLFLTVRRRSLSLGLYGLASWNVAAWGLLAGVLRPRVPPTTPLAVIRIRPSAAE